MAEMKRVGEIVAERALSRQCIKCMKIKDSLLKTIFLFSRFSVLFCQKIFFLTIDISAK